MKAAIILPITPTQLDGSTRVPKCPNWLLVLFFFERFLARVFMIFVGSFVPLVFWLSLSSASELSHLNVNSGCHEIILEEKKWHLHGLLNTPNTICLQIIHYHSHPEPTGRSPNLQLNPSSWQLLKRAVGNTCTSNWGAAPRPQARPNIMVTSPKAPVRIGRSWDWARPLLEHRFQPLFTGDKSSRGTIWYRAPEFAPGGRGTILPQSTCWGP